MTTKIEWCDETINPIIGCKRQCPYCYASRQATRLATFPHTAERYQGIARNGKWTGEMRFVMGQIEKLDQWRRPKRVFIGSMGDLGDAPANWIRGVLDAVKRNPRHTCMVLTKNPARLGNMVLGYSNSPPPNLWVGTTIESDENAHRLDELTAIPAAARFVSYEPALGPVDLDLCPGNEWGWWCGRCGKDVHPQNVTFDENHAYCGESVRWRHQIDWVIAGAETGPGKCEAPLEWLRSVRDQAQEAGVPFFFKKTSGGSHELDGRVHEAFPSDGTES